MKLETKILKAIAEAPSTASELGAVLFPKLPLRKSMRRCSAYCCLLRSQGKVVVVGKVARDGNRGNKCMSNLWMVAELC